MSGKIAKALTCAPAKPFRMWIDGKCFNLKRFNDKWKKHSSKNSHEDYGIETDMCHTRDNRNDDSKLITNLSMQKNDDGRFYISFKLPNFYYQKLQSGNNLDIKHLEEKTKTNIEIPYLDNEGKLTIVGDNETNLEEAVNYIHSFIGFIRDKNTALQFATIPLLSTEIQSNFQKFKKEILEDEEIENINESLFIKEQKLHLTINVFVLLDEREIQEATNALNNFKKDYLMPLLKKTGPLKIHVQGIDCMNSNYTKVNVVYANAKILGAHEDANLQKITNDLSDYFYERGLLKRHQGNVKIHMTLMNAKYRKVPGSGKSRFSKRQSIDASKIMEKFKNYEFGICDLTCVRIAHIFAPPDKDGFYKTLAEVKLQQEEEDIFKLESESKNNVIEHSNYVSQLSPECAQVTNSAVDATVDKPKIQHSDLQEESDQISTEIPMSISKLK